MGAIRAEVPCVSIAFAPIGMCHGHGALCSFRKVSGLTSEPELKTQLGDGRKPSERRVGYELEKSLIRISEIKF